MLKCVQRRTHNSTHVMVSDGRERKLGRKAGSQAGREAGGTRDHKRDNARNKIPKRKQVAEKEGKKGRRYVNGILGWTWIALNCI